MKRIIATVMKTAALTTTIFLVTNLSASAANIIFCDTDAHNPQNVFKKLTDSSGLKNTDYSQDNRSIIWSDKGVINPTEYKPKRVTYTPNNNQQTSEYKPVTYTQNSQEVPEPLTVLGTGFAFALGTLFKRNSSIGLNFGDN